MPIALRVIDAETGEEVADTLRTVGSPAEAMIAAAEYYRRYDQADFEVRLRAFGPNEDDDTAALTAIAGQKGLPCHLE